MHSQIKELPKGHITSSRTKERYKWYQSDGRKSKYIPHEKRELIEKLVKKKYLMCKLEKLQAEEKTLQTYIDKYQKNVMSLTNPEEFLNEESRYYPYLKSEYKPVDKKIEAWLKEPYNTCTTHMELLKHKASDGKYVRSKSEAIIDNYLYDNNIPFKYECELILGKQIVYPDFTIMHPKTGEIYYWEHCGLMDDERYVDMLCKKLKEYTNNGIFPSVNLILTYETGENPLSIDEVKNLIKYYFL